MKTARQRLGTAAALRLSGLALCGLVLLSLSPKAIAGGAATADPVQALGLAVPNAVVAAPGFSLPDLAGTTVRLKTFRGTLVLLNFFATWCGPCREEMPGMERLYRAHRDQGFAVVAVNLHESAKTVRPFVQELKLSFPTVLDVDGAVGRAYGVRALPVTFLVGRDGTIVWRAIGGRDWESTQAKKLFAQLVRETK